MTHNKNLSFGEGILFFTSIVLLLSFIFYSDIKILAPISSDEFMDILEKTSHQPAMF